MEQSELAHKLRLLYLQQLLEGTKLHSEAHADQHSNGAIYAWQMEGVRRASNQLLFLLEECGEGFDANHLTTEQKKKYEKILDENDKIEAEIKERVENLRKEIISKQNQQSSNK